MLNSSLNARNHHILILYIAEIDLTIVCFSFYPLVQDLVMLLLVFSIVKLMVIMHFNMLCVHCSSIHSMKRDTGKLFHSGLQNCIIILKVF